MVDYTIQRWDALSFGNSLNVSPAIYIKPDISFLDHSNKNKAVVRCTIKGSGTPLDGKEWVGTVNKSSEVPNCRPNYFEETGYYIITLQAPWVGYPDPEKLGTVSFTELQPMSAVGNPSDKFTYYTSSIFQNQLVVALIVGTAVFFSLKWLSENIDTLGKPKVRV